jgi:hypothetical protein
MPRNIPEQSISDAGRSHNNNNNDDDDEDDALFFFYFFLIFITMRELSREKP